MLNLLANEVGQVETKDNTKDWPKLLKGYVSNKTSNIWF